MVGAETIINDIWSNLKDQKLRILALLGVGGNGKTALLKQIFNKLAITPCHFYPVIWVTVSGYLCVEKIQDDISKMIGVFDSNWVQKSFDEKSKALAQFLCQKRFLLILDDVWEPFQFSDIGVPCVESGAEFNDFNVILASRSEPVCRRLGAQAIIRVGILREEAAWALFTEKIGEHNLNDQCILHLAKLIAQQCRGLPLALCTVALAMACRTTFEEWVDALRQVLAASHKDINVGPLLNFCLDSLPSNVTISCLLYFSLFPEDCSIPKNELIDFWICEQLLGLSQDVLNLGYNNLDTLIEASLLLEEQVNYVKLQDLVRDMALLKAIRSEMLYNAQLIEATDNKALETVGWIVPKTDFAQNIA